MENDRNNKMSNERARPPPGFTTFSLNQQWQKILAERNRLSQQMGDPTPWLRSSVNQRTLATEPKQPSGMQETTNNQGAYGSTSGYQLPHGSGVNKTYPRIDVNTQPNNESKKTCAPCPR